MFPKVVIVSNNPKIWDDQIYEGQIETIYGEGDSDNCRFFNTAINSLDISDDILYLFLSHRDNFVSKFVVSYMVSHIQKHELFNIAYSDIYIQDHNDIINRQYYKAFAPDTVRSHTSINSPIMIKGSLLKNAKFNENVDTFYFYVFILQLVGNIYPIHIQSPLFITKYTKHISVTAELELIKKCLTP